MNTEQLNAEKTVLVLGRELSELKITLANERVDHRKLEKQLEDMTDERDVYKQKYEDKMDETSSEYPDGVAEAIAEDNYLTEMNAQSNFMVDELIDDGAPGAYAPWVVTGEDD